MIHRTTIKLQLTGKSRLISNSVHISPKSLYSLIVHWSASDNTASIQPLCLQHVPSNFIILHSKITLDRRAKIVSLHELLSYMVVWVYDSHQYAQAMKKQTNKREDGTLTNIAPLLPHVKFEVHVKELGIFKSNWNILCNQLLFLTLWHKALVRRFRA